MTTAIATAAPVRGKSPDAFRTISEVSLELDVPQHVLRFWEARFTQVHPVKRAGGRRFYRPDDVALLRGIRSLLYSDGYTIKGVQKVLRDRGWRHVAEIGRKAEGFVPWSALDTAGPDDDGARPALAGGAKAAIAALRRAHGDAGEKVAMAEHKRVGLELLLAELLVLRDRLKSARTKA